MKSSCFLEETCDSSINSDLSFRGNRNPAQEFQKGALTRPIATNDPDHITLLDLKGNIPQRPNVALRQLSLARRRKPAERPAHGGLDRMAQALIAIFAMTDCIAFAE